MKNRSLGLVTLLAPTLFACGGSGLPTTAESPAPGAGIAPAAAITLEQGWTQDELDTWLNTSTGSRLIPLSWAKALEQPDSEGLFLDNAYVSSFGLPLREAAGGLTLPRGMAVDISDDSRYGDTRQRWIAGQSSTEPWLGLNCSGCHSADIKYQGKTLSINAGATLADTLSLFESLNRAMERTQADAAKFGRFAQRVLGAADNDGNRAMLKTSMQNLIDARNALFELSATDLRGGPGRLDATGLVLNGWQLILHSKELTHNPTDAPTSFPPLWNVPQMDHLQSSGFAPSLNVIDSNGYRINPLLFMGNVGVVVGDFGDVVASRTPFIGYTSSINMDTLVKFGDLLNKLKAPVWPNEVFGVPDATLVAQGKSLYEVKGCGGCHAVMDRNDLETPIRTTLVPLRGEGAIGTDPWMACNTYQFTAQTGDVQGMPIMPDGTPSRAGLLGNRAKIGDIQATAALLIVAGKVDQLVSSTASSYASALQQQGFLPAPGESVFQLLTRLSPTGFVFSEAEPPVDKEARKAACLATDHPWLAYRARPLNGIWATAPYLHDGSVPSLHDLLLPPDQRPQTFFVGSQHYDPVNLGYQTVPDSEGNRFLFDTRLEGNSNAGHEFPKEGLTDGERKALLEYLKTL